MVLHIISNSIHGLKFYEFINDFFDSKDHFFVITNGDNYSFPKVHNNIYIFDRSLEAIIKTYDFSKESGTIILHGFYDIRLILMLNLVKTFRKRVVILFWGGEQYLNPYKGHFKTSTKMFFAYLIKLFTLIRVRKLIVNNSEFEEFPKLIRFGKINYDAHYYHDLDFAYMKKNSLLKGVLIGKAATLSGNHIELMEKLREQFINNEFNVYLPLGKGFDDYKDEIIKEGIRLFGVNYIYYDNYLSFKDYKHLMLNNIDVAVFYNLNQQGFLNILQLIGYGKKIYMRTNSILYKYFTELGFHIYSSDSVLTNLFEIDDDHVKQNVELLNNHFSREVIIKKWERVFSNQTHV